MTLHCSEQCTCFHDYQGTFNIINCTSSHLNIIPNNLPIISITHLKLNHNNIKRIQPYEFNDINNANNFSKLTTIDLSFNELKFIEENTFYGLGQSLKSLKLSFNQLQILLGNEFNGLVGLEVLMLNKNRLQYVSNLTFMGLGCLMYLNLRNNEIRHVVERMAFFGMNAFLRDIKVDRIEFGKDSIELVFNENEHNNVKESWTMKASKYKAIHRQIGFSKLQEFLIFFS